MSLIFFYYAKLSPRQKLLILKAFPFLFLLLKMFITKIRVALIVLYRRRPSGISFPPHSYFSLLKSLPLHIFLFCFQTFINFFSLIVWCLFPFFLSLCSQSTNFIFLSLILQIKVLPRTHKKLSNLFFLFGSETYLRKVQIIHFRWG